MPPKARELRQIGLSVTVVGRFAQTIVVQSRLRQSPLRLASPMTLSPGPPHGPCMTVVISRGLLQPWESGRCRDAPVPELSPGEAGTGTVYV